MAGPSSGSLPAPVRVLVGTSFIVAIGYGIVAPALPAFARSFDVSITAASAVVSAFAVFRLVFAPVSGWMVGRGQELRVLSAGLVVVAISSGACAFAATYWQMLVLRAVGGIGSTMFTVAAAALLIRLAPPSERGRAVGAWATGFLVGSMAGPLIGGVLITISLRAPFLAYCALLLFAAVHAPLVLRGSDSGGSLTAESVEAPVSFAAGCREPLFRAALTSNFLLGWTVYGVWAALVPLYVAEELGLPMSWAGGFLTLSAAGTVLTLSAGGVLADSRGRRFPAALGLGITAVGALLPAVATSTAVFLLASFLVGAGTGLVDPPTNAAVADLITNGGPGARGGTALAGFEMVGDIGAVVGPVLAGLMAQTGGYSAAFLTTTIIACSSFLVWTGTRGGLVRGAAPRWSTSPTGFDDQACSARS